MIKILKEPCKSWKPNAGKANKSQQHSAHPQFIFCGLFSVSSLAFNLRADVTKPPSRSGHRRWKVALCSRLSLYTHSLRFFPEIGSGIQRCCGCTVTKAAITAFSPHCNTAKLLEYALAISSIFWYLLKCLMYICYNKMQHICNFKCKGPVHVMMYVSSVHISMMRSFWNNGQLDGRQSNSRSWIHTQNLCFAVLCRLIAKLIPRISSIVAESIQQQCLSFWARLGFKREKKFRNKVFGTGAWHGNPELLMLHTLLKR